MKRRFCGAFKKTDNGNKSCISSYDFPVCRCLLFCLLILNNFYIFVNFNYPAAKMSLSDADVQKQVSIFLLCLYIFQFGIGLFCMHLLGLHSLIKIFKYRNSILVDLFKSNAVILFVCLFF